MKYGIYFEVGLTAEDADAYLANLPLRTNLDVWGGGYGFNVRTDHDGVMWVNAIIRFNKQAARDLVFNAVTIGHPTLHDESVIKKFDSYSDEQKLPCPEDRIKEYYAPGR